MAKQQTPNLLDEGSNPSTPASFRLVTRKDSSTIGTSWGIMHCKNNVVAAVYSSTCLYCREQMPVKMVEKRDFLNNFRRKMG